MYRRAGGLLSANADFYGAKYSRALVTVRAGSLRRWMENVECVACSAVRNKKIKHQKRVSARRRQVGVVCLAQLLY